jgi:micrococcal nuclease
VLRRLVTLFAVLALAAGGYTVTRSSDSGSAAASSARVVRVVDGDTILVSVGGREERVRYIGVDTPETVKPGAPVECFGKRASARNRALVPPGARVRLVRDAEERDRYGRLLAYVYRANDGLFVNAALVRDGYAKPLTIAPNDAHAAEFRALARAARGAGRGLWNACSR